MAERRMFAKSIIESARFLKMPVSSQLLYFHLGMRADDDGVVEAWSVMQMTGATEDDLRVLAAKEFVVVLNDDMVSFIKDWTIHNNIRADRKIDSQYQPLLLQVVPNAAIIRPKQRADRPVLSDENNMGRPWDVHGTTMGPRRLGKDRLGKDSIYMAENPPKNKFQKPTLEQVTAYCNERNNGVDPERFIDHYESIGWKVGKNPMKDWKASVRTWEKNQTPQKPNEQETKPTWIRDGTDEEGNPFGHWEGL